MEFIGPISFDGKPLAEDSVGSKTTPIGKRCATVPDDVFRWIYAHLPEGYHFYSTDHPMPNMVVGLSRGSFVFINGGD